MPVSKIYAQEKTIVAGKAFEKGAVLASIDSPLKPGELVTLLTAGTAADVEPAKEPKPAEPKTEPKP